MSAPSVGAPKLAVLLCLAALGGTRAASARSPEAAPVKPAAPPASRPAAGSPTSQPAAGSGASPTRVALLDWGSRTAAEAAPRLGSVLVRAGRFEIVLRQEIALRLRESRKSQEAASHAAAALDEGRGHEIELNFDRAEASYRRAQAALEEALTQVHGPEPLARVHLALGAVSLHRGQRAQADEEFRRALSLAPGLEPDPSYNPQVRAAFAVVRREPRLPPPPPSTPELARMAALLRADAVILLEHESGGGRRALRGSLFSASKRAFVAVESRALAAEGALVPEDIEALGARLGEALDALFPRPRVAVEPPRPPRRTPLPPPPPPRPWYKRWWVWSAVGVVAFGSLTLPLVFLRHDTVNLVVRY
jgi:hypothetical protein